MDSSRTPVTIITGYLGAGKTSLLQHILTTSTKKLAVLMNEFGEINIDGKIIQGRNVQIRELAGGCVCCSLIGEFELAVREIIEKAKPEWIVLETTGVAEPSALAFDIEESLPEIRTDAIVTIVDGDALLRFPNLGHTGLEQIQLADILLLNKIDIMSERQVEKAEAQLRMLNPKAVLAKSIHGRVPPTFLFGLEKDQKAKLQKRDPHAPETEVFVFESGDRFGKEKFEAFAKGLPPSVYRAKGFVRCEDGSYLFNLVGGRMSMEPFSSDKTELVFIGKDVLKLEADVKAKLERCRA